MSEILAAAPNADTLRKQFDGLRLKYAEMRGNGQAMRQRFEELTKAVALAKARVELAPSVTQLFEAMQERAHQRSVGVFEDLLTAIVQDVFPDKGSVKLTLGTERSAPALDITIKNGEKEEDILEGNGGAITNVIVTGLRYAARSRTKTRPLMVLDESDCWIKPDRVPAFMKVVTDIAAQTETQTLLISHHDAEFLGEGISVVRLESGADGTRIAVPLEPRPATWENNDQPGLRWIELTNVRAHTFTRIPLNPGVNALIGENDLGKSTAFVPALRAVAYGESDDTILRHGADFAKIRIGLEQGYVIEWTRKSKGTPKVMYALYKDDVLLNEGKPETRGGVPAFVADLLNICRVDDLDIQLTGQKQPIFLLDEPPSRRAQLLSVGRESGFLHALIEKQRDWLRRDRETIRDGEAELMRLQRRLRALEDLRDMPGLIELLSQLLNEVESSEKAEKAVRQLVLRIEAYSREVGTMQQRRDALARLPREVPVLQPQQPLERLIMRFSRASQAAALELPAALPVAPELLNNLPIVEMGRRLAALEKILVAGTHLPSLPAEAPEITRLNGAVFDRLAKSVHMVAALEAQHKGALADLSSAELDYELLKEEVGGLCPLCEQPFTNHSH